MNSRISDGIPREKSEGWVRINPNAAFSYDDSSGDACRAKHGQCFLKAWSE